MHISASFQPLKLPFRGFDQQLQLLITYFVSASVFALETLSQLLGIDFEHFQALRSRSGLLEFALRVFYPY